MTGLRIGRFSYSNLFPIFYMLEKMADCSVYEFIEGVPSELNLKLRKGEIDISPSSSFEYLRNPAAYELIPGHSISSAGPVGSIFLFSRLPLESLEGRNILTTSQSETSVALLKIILNKFYGIDCLLKTSSDPIEKAMEGNDAYLLIGDDALVESRRREDPYLFDLGDLWYRHTALPAVFALWMAAKERVNEKRALYERFVRDLGDAKAAALRSFGHIAAASPLSGILGREGLVAYWSRISYDFGEEHQRGLDLFRRYALELAII